MRAPPSPADAARYPATAGLLAVAVLASVGALVAGDLDRWVLDGRAFHGQGWRLATSVVVHVGPVHLVFNALWLWVLGTALERSIGPARLAGATVVLAAAGGLAEFALLDGGVGLSGVVYGYLGMALALAPGDRRLADVADRRVVALFAGWFVACVVATRLGLATVGNVAHAVGAVAGIGLGWSLGRPRRWPVRAVALAAVGAALVGAALGATVGRPLVNRSPEAADRAAALGRRALDHGRVDLAIGLYGDAAGLEPGHADRWTDLGLALQEAGRTEEAQAAFERARELR